MTIRSSTTVCIGLLLTSLALTAQACSSTEDFKSSCQQCIRQLVLAWKLNPRSNCSVQYKDLVQCLVTNKAKCLTLSRPDNRTVHNIQRLFTVYSASEVFFCKDGMLDTLTSYKNSDLKMCTKKLFIKAAKCTKRFQERFSRNRGSQEMCRWYYKARQCMMKAIMRNCNPSSKMTSYLKAHYGKPYNPYCKDSRDNVKRRVRKGSTGFGRCTRKSFQKKSRECTVRFIRELQRNEGQRCRSIVSAVLIPCVKNCMKQCLRGTRDNKSLDIAIGNLMERKRTVIQNDKCEGSHLETLSLSREQCSEEYFENFQGKCNSKFLAEYRKNRADPQLCQHYSDVKRCARNMTLSMCKLDSAMNKRLHFVYGSFNPFCSNGRDPSPSSQTFEQYKKALKSNAITRTWSVFTLVTSTVVTKRLLS